ncbi:hypothetical protein [Seleniivibrio woodruffii]|uniref:Uncharacterized protein n=1 Tax=Seleniivibrio woodruffii TaxID=1078050 RepID=A0A4R1K2X2_9BACT|nr:hypothetical protein [Seleniivibrio woodruffii]TCK58187.1 hypothetical protein C8D98_2702 [Seleniivibrio woodruffii]TVZ35652.1 hypothetical protein OF66_1267 [Seleniivibrio woodruffii]
MTEISFSDIIQNLGSLSAMVLLPLWRSIGELRKGQERTNIILARDYVAKNECKHKHQLLHSDISRIHERVDEII